MPTVAVFDMTGKKTGEMELNAAVFGIEPNMTVVHAAVKNYLANQRQGTQSTLTRAEVRGGGKGRQQRGTAVLAGLGPRLAAAGGVGRAWRVAVRHNADVGEARARHVGGHEVDHAVAPAERHRAGHARFGQLAKAGSLFIGKDDAVQSVHRTVSFPSTLRMRLAGST